jgi:hypothetical protein
VPGAKVGFDAPPVKTGGPNAITADAGVETSTERGG